MSDGGDRGPDPFVSIRDMVGFCETIMSRTDGLDFDAFTSSEILYEATLWNIALIGEAVTNVSDEIEDAYPQIPWQAMVDARNRLVHQYWKISENLVWNIVAIDVPALLPMLRAILADSE